MSTIGAQCSRCAKWVMPKDYDDDLLVCESCLNEILGSAELRKLYRVDPPDDDEAFVAKWKEQP